MAEGAAEQSELCAQHEKGSKQATGHWRRIRHRAEAEAQQENQWEHAERRPAGEGALRDVVTAADQRRREKTERSDRCADDGGTNFDRPSAEPVHCSERSEQRAVVEVPASPATAPSATKSGQISTPT